MSSEIGSLVSSALGGVAGFAVGGAPGAAIGASLGSQLFGGQQQAQASQQGSAAQQQAYNQAAQQQNAQFAQTQANLAPFMQNGINAMGGLNQYAQNGANSVQGLQNLSNIGGQAAIQEQSLLGLNGAQNQQNAINAVQNTPQFQAYLNLGERGITQNAAATGGLRGGNTQQALMQYAPQLLSNTINQQYGMLNGLVGTGANANQSLYGTGANAYQNMVGLGQNSAANVGNMGQQNASQIGNYLGAGANAAATGYMGQALPTSNFTNAINGAIGMAGGLYGINNFMNNGNVPTAGIYGNMPNSASTGNGLSFLPPNYGSSNYMSGLL